MTEWPPWAPSEDTHAYDGPFSHRGESHAFLSGALAGARTLGVTPRDPPADETHYYRLGYWVGTLAQLAALAWLVRYARKD